MAKGQKTGGRKAGTPNKVNAPIAQTLRELFGADGIEQAAEQLRKLAIEPHGDPHVRMKALQTAAPYLWKKQPVEVEHSGPDGGPIDLATTVIHEHHPKS